ncbi:aldehyde dehydrogenase [Roseofilum reptotaenium CS-1145]|uniref:Aldehyde dehydrogenase n=1 Tax=Roseofilum reptotaenium AO1-A TaxID=1925591 RepID=A0A1L9QNL6_9CYAN|nr:aldehyde dehydrogenase [Roseofilum reptotaenium CS-1145]OJJ24261.1 aldehyde dehydrogenase family protein [Roseofilum reptotaenium AO1-A]
MKMNGEQLIAQQREFFRSGQTRELKFRKSQLKKLRSVIEENKSKILAGLKEDLNKPKLEGYYEFSPIAEIDYALKHLNQWVKPKRTFTPFVMWPSVGEIYPEPLGVVLIISAWNYPFNLAIAPLVGAIAAGNCAVVKPSEIAPKTSNILAEIITENFDPNSIAVLEGNAEVSQELLAQKFDHILFTGSARVGKIVMEAAAKYLTPVTLELGGKNPCIVDRDCDLTCTARRIIWGKFFNAGQICIAPDYVLVNRKVKADLIQAMLTEVKAFYGENPEESPDYARIVNDKQFNYLQRLLQEGNILCGGKTNPKTRYIAPTLIDGITWDSLVMQEEIFGPILPILDYGEIEEAIAEINQRPKPLALYLFSKRSRVQRQVLQQVSSGTVALNDTVLQFNIPQLPFGGVGQSGMGRYHGLASFQTFSHYKSVLRRWFWLDLNLRYPPYGNKLQLLKRLLRY